MQEMKFDQKKTMIGQLVDFTVDMFEDQRASCDNAKLLVVLSDGRGIFSEGMGRVNSAVRRARLVDIFLVFVIIDNPINKVISYYILRQYSYYRYIYIYYTSANQKINQCSIFIFPGLDLGYSYACVRRV